MVRRSSGPEYGPKKKTVRKNECWVGAVLYVLDEQTGKVMAVEADKEPYMAEPEDIPDKLRHLLADG